MGTRPASLVERQRLDPDTRVVGADDTVKTSGDRLLCRGNTDHWIAAVVDRHDLDVLAAEATVRIDLIGRELGTVEHPLAEGPQLTREWRLQADSPLIRVGIRGVACPSAR